MPSEPDRRKTFHVTAIIFRKCVLFSSLFSLLLVAPSSRCASFSKTQVQASASKLAAKYRKARQSIREAAAAADSVKKEQERKAAQAKKLKVCVCIFVPADNSLRKKRETKIKKFFLSADHRITTLLRDGCLVLSTFSFTFSKH